MIAIFTGVSALSALLLFWIQPMVGKLILPILGGVPSVWNVCLVFYQCVLLAAYAYAHFSTTRLSFAAQARVHALLLLASIAFLPLSLFGAPDSWRNGHPQLWLLAVLAVSVGLPIFTLSATSPLLQKWFSRTGVRSSDDPYFLYAASNAGSLLGLLSYPLLVERFYPVAMQKALWGEGFIVFALVFLAIGWKLGSKRTATQNAVAGEAEPASWKDRGRWTVLAFIPSSLLMGATAYLSTDIAPVPLLWVVPLALYLATFVLAFARRQIIPRALAARAVPFLVPLVLYGIFTEGHWPAWVTVAVNLAGLFAASLSFHGELARLRPGHSRLTEFYFCLAVGGALGGIFNTLVGPVVFKTILEYPITLVLAGFLMPAWKNAGEDGPRGADFLFPAVLGGLTLALVKFAPPLGFVPESMPPRNMLLAPLVLCWLFASRRWRFGSALAVILVIDVFLPHGQGRVLFEDRSFFGTLSVTVDKNGEYRGLTHGQAIHGGQSLDPARSREPLTYYHPSGPAGDIFYLFRTRPAATVAVVGLGAGSLASYARPDQRWIFYEIDPLVQRIAEDERYFTFLKTARAPYSVVLGDARLSLADAPDGTFDLLVVDAFGSDAVPIHLLTREALEMYFHKAKGDGLVAFHVSNRFLDLERVLSGVAQSLGVRGIFRSDSFMGPEDFRLGKFPSQWILFSRDPARLSDYVRHMRWKGLAVYPEDRPWTDDFSNLLGVFRWS